MISRSNHPEVFLVKDVQKICSRFTGEHPYQSLILIKLQSNLLHIFRTLFTKNSSERHLFNFIVIYCQLLQVPFKKSTWFKQSSSCINISPNRQHGSNQVVHISIFVLRSLVSRLLLNL